MLFLDRLAATQGQDGNNTSGNPAGAKHHLQNRWTFWYKQPQQGRGGSDWGQGLVQIVEIDTVEDFWALVNNVKEPTQLAMKSSYMLFKSGVKPEWEDPNNQKGFNLEIPIPSKTPPLLNQMWEELLMILIGEQLDSDYVNGIWVNIRQGGHRFEIWLKAGPEVETIKSMSEKLKGTLVEAIRELSTSGPNFRISCKRLGNDRAPPLFDV